jgi:hypothetical protein
VALDVQELYRRPPEEFTAARDEAAKAAKAAGDRPAAAEIKALRKPSVSAWIVNLLAGLEPELLQQLLDLGPALAQAQAEGQGQELRDLSAQRRELVTAVTARAVALAERPVTSTVREEVAATLDAALADPASAEAVRSGHLVRALSYAGFGGVDLAGAVAVTTARAPARRKQPQPDAVAAAEAAALEAAGRLDDLVHACERAERDRAAAAARAAEAAGEVDRLRAALQDAEAVAQEADRARRTADTAAEQAFTAVRRAQKGEEQARAELDRLRRGD